LTARLLVISRQQKTLDDVGYIAERQRVVPTSDNHTLAVLHFLGHTPKVQSITGSKKGTWAQDNGLYIAGKQKAPQQTITLCLADTIGVGIRSKQLILGEKTAVSKTIDGVRTGVNEAAYTCSLGCFIEILRAFDIDQAIIGKRAPHTHHSCQVKDNLHIFNGGFPAASIGYVSPPDPYTVLDPVIGIFCR